MDPISIGIMAVGTGLSLFGQMGARKAAKKDRALAQQISQQEILLERQRRQAMRLDASRKLIENIRNSQLARAVATNNSVNQNAQFGSGIAGGMAQISGRENWNALGIEQNLQIGENMFGINEKISGLKAQRSEAQSDMYDSQGLSQLGSTLVKIGPTVGSLAGGQSLSTSQSSAGMQTWAGFTSSFGRGGLY
jgi:hypothetical protein